MRTLFYLTFLCSSMLPVSVVAQTGTDKTPPVKPNEIKTAKMNETDDAAAQRRIFAVPLVTSLAAEARSYRDRALRPRVLARAADALGDADKDAALLLFRRAWEAAEAGDADDLYLKSTTDGAPAVVLAIVKRSGRDLRSEVLVSVGRRDRTLAEEFLTKLKDEIKRESADSRNDAQTTNYSWTNSEAEAKRLYLASRFFVDGEVA